MVVCMNLIAVNCQYIAVVVFLSVGTAFVKFTTKESVEKCLQAAQDNSTRVLFIWFYSKTTAAHLRHKVHFNVKFSFSLFLPLY